MTASSSSQLTEYKANSKSFAVPTHIHFIWIGGAIPEDYLRTIYEVLNVAVDSHFTVNLWVDDKKNYEKTATQLCVDSLPRNLVIRDINELKNKMEKDIFYKEKDKIKKFWKYVDAERVGLKNLAAASDFLRYEILRQEGGYYFDTDTKFDLNKKSKFIPETLEYGIKINMTFSSKCSQSKIYKVEKISVGNDCIASYGNHPVMQQCIDMALEAYQEEKMIEIKRYGVQKIKCFLTIACSGPNILERAFRTHLKMNKNDSCFVMTQDQFRQWQAMSGTTFAGVSIFSESDATWLQPVKIKFFDDSSIPRSLLSANKKNDSSKSNSI